MRTWGDYSRYLHPRFADAPLLRERAAHKAKRRFRNRRRWAGSPTGWGGSTTHAAADALGRPFPADGGGDPAERGASRDWLRDQGYDAVLVSPLVDHGSDQADLVKAAQLAGIPTGALITSWDNLTTKGVIRAQPDRVFVWNETQKREAAEMHGVPSGRVVSRARPGSTRGSRARRAAPREDS